MITYIDCAIQDGGNFWDERHMAFKRGRIDGKIYLRERLGQEFRRSFFLSHVSLALAVWPSILTQVLCSQVIVTAVCLAAISILV